MSTMNIGGWDNDRDFITARNSITAPHESTMQVQSSLCRKIPFCIICGFHISVEENTSLLVYYTELIGKEIVMCQSSMLPASKGKGVPVHVVEAYGELE